MSPWMFSTSVFYQDVLYHIVVDIVMSEPGTFDLGMFHFAKVLLRCAGRYLSGSGMGDALIECEMFGPKQFRWCYLVATTSDH